MKTGNIVVGIVVDIKKTHMIIKIKEDWTGLVHVSEVSDYYVADLHTMFHLGEKYYFQVIEIKDDKRVKLSWKILKPRFLKDPFEFNLEETENGFKNIKNNTEKEVDND